MGSLLLLLRGHKVGLIFGLAGVGRAVFEGITSRDFPIIQGFVLFIAIGYVTLNLLIDLSYAFLDPRIRLD